MALLETVWFVPFDAPTTTLQSAYAVAEAPVDAPEAIAPGTAFTVSLATMRLARQPKSPWYERIMHPDTDILILTAAALGAKPMIERIHYYRSDIDLEKPLLAHDLLSDVIWVCDDYQPPDAFYVELQVVTIGRSGERRETALRGFETLANTAGSIFPVALPYVALGDMVLQGLNKAWEAGERREAYRIAEPIKLFPPHTPRTKTLRAGQYVVLSGEIDGTQYQLGNDGELATRDGNALGGEATGEISYAVIRIDPVAQVQLDFVISQRVATLLTQLKNDREGQPAGALKTSLGFLTDTLTAYTSFKDLERYRTLAAKGDSRAPGEIEQMRQLERRPDLQPWLPKPSVPALAPGSAAVQP